MTEVKNLTFKKEKFKVVKNMRVKKLTKVDDKREKVSSTVKKVEKPLKVE